MKKQFILILIIVAGIYSCEDPVPTDYDPQNYLEAYLVVGESIDNIRLMRTQPILDSFDYEESLIRNADVIIRGEGQEFNLVVEDTGDRGYYSPDTSYKVKKNTQYEIEVILADGSRITGKTTTPDTVYWAGEVPNEIQFPIDTINKPSSDTLFWDGENPLGYYGLAITCLDTLNYGKYLDPPTDEKNRRVTRRGSDNPDREWRYNEFTTWALLPSTEVPVIWEVFRWYGLHEVAIHNTDYNYIRWVLQSLGQSEFDKKLSSVEGNGFGVFGSTNTVRDTFLLLKNQP